MCVCLCLWCEFVPGGGSLFVVFLVSVLVAATAFAMPKIHTFQNTRDLPFTAQFFTRELFYKDSSFTQYFHETVRGDLGTSLLV